MQTEMRHEGVFEALERAGLAGRDGSPEARAGRISQEVEYVRAVLGLAQAAVAAMVHWDAINDQLLAETGVGEALGELGLSIEPIRYALMRDAFLRVRALTDNDDGKGFTLCRIAKWLSDQPTAHHLVSRQRLVDRGVHDLLIDGTIKGIRERIERIRTTVPLAWKQDVPVPGELGELRKKTHEVRHFWVHANQDEPSSPLVNEYRRLVHLTHELANDAAWIWQASGVDPKESEKLLRENAEQFWSRAFKAPVGEWAERKYKLNAMNALNK